LKFLKFIDKKKTISDITIDFLFRKNESISKILIQKRKIIIINHNFFVSIKYDIEKNFKKNKLNDNPKIKL